LSLNTYFFKVLATTPLRI